MAYNLRYKKPAAEDVQALSPQIKKRLGEKLAFFAGQKNCLEFAKTLTKPADAQYRFRVGDFRILFDLEGDNIVVLRIQHRREVYKK